MWKMLYLPIFYLPKIAPLPLQWYLLPKSVVPIWWCRPIPHNIGKDKIFHRPGEAMLFVMVKTCLCLKIIISFRTFENFVLIYVYKQDKKPSFTYWKQNFVNVQQDHTTWHKQCYTVSGCLRMDTILILPLFSDILLQLFSSSSSNLAVFLVVFNTIYIFAPKQIQVHNLVDHREYFSLFFVCGWAIIGKPCAYADTFLLS